jgi:hypothetical protein
MEYRPVSTHSTEAGTCVHALHLHPSGSIRRETRRYSG